MSGWFPVPEWNYADPIRRLIPYQHNQQTNNQAGDCMAAFSLPILPAKQCHWNRPAPLTAFGKAAMAPSFGISVDVTPHRGWLMSKTYQSNDLSHMIVRACFIFTSILWQTRASCFLRSKILVSQYVCEAGDFEFNTAGAEYGNHNSIFYFSIYVVGRSMKASLNPLRGSLDLNVSQPLPIATVSFAFTRFVEGPAFGCFTRKKRSCPVKEEENSSVRTAIMMLTRDTEWVGAAKMKEPKSECKFVAWNYFYILCENGWTWRQHLYQTH